MHVVAPTRIGNPGLTLRKVSFTFTKGASRRTTPETRGREAHARAMTAAHRRLQMRALLSKGRATAPSGGSPMALPHPPILATAEVDGLDVEHLSIETEVG